MSSNLDRICAVDITLDTPISNEASFDNILILGPAPSTPKNGVTIPAVGVYNSLSEVTELGYVATGDSAEPVGIAARVAFSQTPRPREVYIAIIDVEVAEGGSIQQQKAVDVLNTALGTSGWYCICPVGIDSDEVAEVIQWTETQNKICGYIEDDPDSPIVETGLYYRSFAFYPKVTEDQLDDDVPVENKYGMAAAIAVKAMHYHAGEETWALKSLASITPSKLSSTFISKLSAANISYVTTVASKNVTMGGKTNGGEWIDVIRFRDWLQNDMQVRVANLLIVNPKIPYTDSGIGLVENQMLASLKDGQKYGGICPTEYNSDGEANYGYVTSVPLASDITSTQKNSRVLENCKFSARLAGAIHLVEITGSLHYENLFM